MTPLSEANPAPAAHSLDRVDEVVEAYTDNLMRVAFSLGFREADAEELVQDTFCAFLEGGARFKGRSKLLTYLFGILYNKARTHRRYRDRLESIDRLTDEAFDGRFDAEEHWNIQSMDEMSEVEKKAQSNELGRWLQECLDGLNATLRMAFVMKEVEGLETEEICAALAMTPNNLGVTLFRARNKLRECLMTKGAVIV